jgi:PHD/YefM family antitoxin component YafN of YafNO toxin-antitoxin module
MYSVHENTTIATVADLRCRTEDIMDRAEEGEIVVVQRDDEPHGVYMSYGRYEAMLGMSNRLDDLELALVAVPRRAAIARGEMGTTSLADVIAEFAPELRGAE